MARTGVFHPGRQHSWHTAAAIAEAGELGWYATAIYYDPERLPYRALRYLPDRVWGRVRPIFERRASSAINAASVRHLPAFEWMELALSRLSQRRAARLANRIGNDLFQRSVVRLIQREPVDRVWGYDTSALHVFAHARTQGIVTVLDQSIAHMAGLRDQLMVVRERFGPLINAAEIPTSAEIDRCTAEVRSASHIVVGSDYAARLAIKHGAATGAVHVCPYGYEEANFPQSYVEPPGIGRLPVHFVFVGNVSARKGFHLLADVFGTMPRDRARCTLIGPSTLPDHVLRAHLGNIEYHPAVPNHELRRYLATAHCFLFPSLHEGGGIVLYEAAACGLGIIQSPNCGDGVRNGRLGPNGIVLEDLSSEALRAAVEEVIGRPEILRDWSAASWAMREERSWAAYRDRIAALLPTLN
ncbi:MAG: glycosyltransferase family 4 protein [Reyranellaceae bacterium]